MATLVKEYVTRCDTCQQFKESNMAPAGLLHPLETPSLPWEHISANFITDLPLSNGFDAILTVIDWFSKKVELIPCTKTCSALDIVKLFMHNVWKHHGLPFSLPQTKAHSLLHKSCRKLTRPSAFLLSYQYLSIPRQMVRQRLWIKKFRSSYGSTALKNKINGLIGLPLPSFP